MPLHFKSQIRLILVFAILKLYHEATLKNILSKPWQLSITVYIYFLQNIILVVINLQKPLIVTLIVTMTVEKHL